MDAKERTQMSNYHYETFEDWFYELEKFSFRSERWAETMNMYPKKDIIDTKAIEWLRAAFECGREKEGNGDTE
jgi:hypothetical protein